MRLTHKQFRKPAGKHGLAATHRRPLPSDEVIAHQGHSREPMLAAVHRRIPSISLATDYNSLRLFVERVPLGEVTPPASSLRLDGSLKPHRHRLCSGSKPVPHIAAEFIDYQRLSPHFPEGFDLTDGGGSVRPLPPLPRQEVNCQPAIGREEIPCQSKMFPSSNMEMSRNASASR